MNRGEAMVVELRDIPLREVLHYLGWRGTPVDDALLGQIKDTVVLALKNVQPLFTLRRFAILPDGTLEGTTFAPAGDSIGKMLGSCHEAVLLAATLGAQTERLLLRTQAQDAGKALLLDAALSAGIEEVLDRQEAQLRRQLLLQGLYLTDRFSPGYGDMPVTQTREICEVLQAQRQIGLTVSKSGVMIPRKSVTAIMGISKTPVARRPRGCAGCEARANCAFRREETDD